MTAPIPTPPYELRPVTWEIHDRTDYCGTIHRIGSGFLVSHMAARLSGEIEGRTYPQRRDAEAAIWAAARGVTPAGGVDLVALLRASVEAHRARQEGAS